MRINWLLVLRNTALVLLGLLALVLQTTGYDRPLLWGGGLFFLLPITLAVGACFGHVSGTVFGGILGFCCDATAGTLLGYQALILMLLGGGAGFLSERQFSRNLVSLAVIYGAAYGCLLLRLAFVQLLIRGDGAAFGTATLALLGEALVSLPLLIPCHWVTRRLKYRTQPEL